MNIELEQDVKGLLPEKDYDRRDFIWTALGASAALAFRRRLRRSRSPPTRMVSTSPTS